MKFENIDCNVNLNLSHILMAEVLPLVASCIHRTDVWDIRKISNIHLN